MFTKSIRFMLAAACVALLASLAGAASGTREFQAAADGTLTLDLEAGGDVEVRGTGGSSISVSYELDCSPKCDIEFEQSGDDLTIRTRFERRGSSQSSSIDLTIEVPSRFDVEIDSMGGGLEIEGVDGDFGGKTMGGALRLHDVRGEARLTTMGGEIRLTDSELDGSLKTMGGEVWFENVIGDVKGSSMGGNVRYKNVQRRDGGPGSPARTGRGNDEISPETVQISTMGGDIEVEDALEGAELHTMGGDIEIRNARRFVRAKTMGGDIEIDSLDGWVRATTMGGDIEVSMTGRGGEVELTSMSGDVTLFVPAGHGMEVDLEVAFTRNSKKKYAIECPGVQPAIPTPEWDYDHGSPRKYLRSSGTVNGGGEVVKIRTVNGNIRVIEQ